MSEKNVIVVFGATGAAGGSVARYLLEDGTFTVRAVTRDASGSKAKVLAAQGAEVVEADLAKSETIAAALHGAYGVSALTDFWTILPSLGFDLAKTQAEEERQGRALIDAAVSANVKQFLWFSLPEQDCPHYMGKANATKYLLSTPGLPHTVFENVFYYENFAHPTFGLLAPSKDVEGEYTVNLALPKDIPVLMYSVEQTGAWVLEAFKNPDKWIGQLIHAVGDILTTTKIAAALSKASGKRVVPLDLSETEFHGQADSDNVYVRDFYLMIYIEQAAVNRYPIAKTIKASAEVNPAQQDFETFLKLNQNIRKFLASLV
ncbi:NAD(P)-binding protein [Auriculariales sp. MPI-PUGE-AT-0066]|nr:NAD(P)-binding protein [Auriculariales sp. MPI-PUGE-AT-0066]